MELVQASVAHLRVFGCIAYAKIPEARRIKLDNKGEKCIFVGYGDRVMGYKLYNPLTKKVIISRDVVFEEAQTWSWEDKKVASSSEIVPDQQEDAREVEEPDSPTSSEGPVGRPRRMRNLNDIYEATEEVDEAVEENVNLISIGEETWMKERALSITVFILEMLSLLGRQRSKRQ
ncbi:hypothetical protein SASPL_105049 [Salvia splendens]|uniref:Retroviral polymerase SH3-like domain-containing protein n=1 Tax=Salvia splendens TaxID=180675 RepID=A0A8X8YKK1_SALSN|nr:hypothetical protein SASPL_105049 [Salvia splendens]